MTELSIPETIFNAFFNNYYDKIEIYSCILLSLVLQIFLNVGGTFRRLASSRWIVILLWLAYLLADIVAIFGLGLVVSGERMFVRFCNVTEDYYIKSHQESKHASCTMNNYAIFWAPFFLVHLGGPDTITAFAPEDNELWPRHLIYLASQCFAVAYIFYQSLQFHNHVVIPTLLMLLCGIIKCVERTAALYYGSAQSFRNSMLTRSNQDASIKEKESKLLIIKKGDALSDLQVLQYAFVYFTVFKKLVVDLVLSIHERDQSRLFFLATSCEDAFRLVEIELNYLYDVLFTKLPVLHHTLGYCSRSLSFLAVVTSLLCISRTSLLHSRDEQEVVTLILVIGAVGSELIAFYLLLFCDWTIINIRPLSANTNGNFCTDKFLDFILFVNKTRSRFLHWFLRFVGHEHLHHGSKFTDSRWANSLSTFNLIFYCLHRPSKRMDSIYSYFGLISFLNGVWYVKPLQLLSHSMTSFIFDELKMKSEKAESLVIAKEIFSSKGEWVLENEGQGTFLPFVADYNYDDILLLWHIATDICYNDSQDQLTDKEQSETAKKLSDYMLYLMVMKPDMMSAVSGIGEKKFQDTCTEVGKLFDTKLPELKKRKSCNFFRREGKEKNEALQRKARETILGLNREIEPDAVPRDRSILINASILAGKLKLLPSEKKWLIISKLWVELLSYGATHIRSSAHAEQLSRGGELITVVWLLMAHFGLGDQYENNPDN